MDNKITHAHGRVHIHSSESSTHRLYIYNLLDLTFVENE